MSELNKWDKRFMKMAQLVASWSKDESTQVGAVLVDQKQRVISIGFNGQPRGCIDCSGLPREVRLMRTVHAEKNAILFAQQPLDGATLYVTAPPCASCACYAVQAGIRRIVALRPSDAFAKRWAMDMHAAEGMYREAMVRFEVIEPDYLV